MFEGAKSMQISPISEASLSQTDAKQTRAERAALYRKLYSVGIGRSPSRLRKQEVARAADLDALADELRAAGTDPDAIVRVTNAADRQRQRLTWLEANRPHDEHHRLSLDEMLEAS
jgi:hypothetical protein